MRPPCPSITRRSGRIARIGGGFALLLAATVAVMPGPAVGRAAPVAPPLPDAPACGDYLAASVALHANDWSFAAEHLLRALAADPRRRSLRSEAFLASALAGRPEAARLASGLPGDAAASLMVGNGLAASGRWDEAARAYANAPADNGLVDTLRPVLVAWSEFGAGHPDLALGAVESLANGGRTPGLYALNAGLIADLAGRIDEAAADFRLAREQSPGIGLDTVRLLASFDARHGRLSDAEALVGALVASAPALGVVEAGLDASLTERPVTGARDGLAEAYLAAGSLLASNDAGNTSALLLLRYGLDLDPDATATRLLMSDVDQSLDVPAAGLAILAPARPADPLAGLVALRRAELEEAVGDRRGAMRDLRALTVAAPGVAEPWRELGGLLGQDGQETAAIDAYDHAIADTGQPGADGWELFFERAVALDRAHQWPKAEADLRRALAISPDQPFVLNYLAYSFAEQDRDLDQAHALLVRALRQKPHDPAFLDSLGWVELEQGDVGGAVATLEGAAEMTPEDPTVNYHLGVAYWRQGRRAEATDQWREALILKPDATDRPRIEARLREADAAIPARSP